ncbi:FAD-dependent oxidoreductase [Brasilonema octagenarum UFV-E1]|uniref:FAD-dependent oxidoreductase n=1 Tax=Brasilonema sennae CENA114 TaxID=415709 RepID=A0A856MCK9_9CYAN|nr:FAD-binding oxidoreductase [Brasilonema sennae]QDL08422.1 FAD-dependent oxidoreductase [Brasilonema sennae CENA114]QDL14777.1 FAD-dependent oxidoreductase [Brasilonema octagenarum UFV-E1]
MKTYDWIVVGAGITGAALAYELVNKGCKVLLLEQYATPHNATRYSYGGLAFWSGTTPLTRQLCDEGIARHRILSQELDADTEFRELDLLLTISADTDPASAAASYTRFAIPPKLLSLKEACELEPLLNQEAIAAALTVKHGHIHPGKSTQAYINAFLRAGGEMAITQVVKILPKAVTTTKETYNTANTVVCAGGLSRQILKSSGISIKLYFTHAEMIETPPVDIQLRTIVMPVNLKRFQLEADSTKNDELWNESGLELVPPILDAGAVQFRDGSIRLGQISRAITDPHTNVDSKQSEAELRASIGKTLPKLNKLPGTWHNCLVSFSNDALPLIGLIPEHESVHVFSGFSNPLVIVPPLAQRFANWVFGMKDEIITKFSPARFQNLS